MTLNSQRYWAAGDPATPTTTGYGITTDPVGDNSAGTPCETSTLDVKATDVDVPKLFSWLGIRPDIKAHARVEIHAVKEESGFLPLAVPEIDPNYVYAIFVDYGKNGTQRSLKVQPLEERPQLRPPRVRTFPYSAWVTNTDVPGPGPKTQRSLSTRITHTATARASSSSCRNRTPPLATHGTLNADLQSDADRPRPVLRGHGQRRLRRRGDGAGAGLHPQLRDSNGTPGRSRFCAMCS